MPSSPAPSSNASVVASDAEDEGFDDIEFPEHGIIADAGAAVPPPRHHPPTLITAKTIVGGGDATTRASLGAQLNIMQQQSHDEDMACDLLIPDGFDWRRPQVDASVIDNAAPQPSLSSTSPTRPSRIPVLRTVHHVHTARPYTTTNNFSASAALIQSSSLAAAKMHNSFHPMFFTSSLASASPSAEADLFADDAFVSSNPPHHNHHHRIVQGQHPVYDRKVIVKDPTTIGLGQNVKRVPRKKKKPTLIRNSFTANDGTAHVVGGMRYNPELQQWEGNEEALLEFDHVAASTSISKLRPALITNKGASAARFPQTVGNMVFDPVNMRWIGNDEDVDVFADLEDESASDSNSKMDTAPLFVELNISKVLKQTLYISESSHKLFLGKWYPKALTDSKTVIRDTSKVHLHDIRRMIVA